MTSSVTVENGIFRCLSLSKTTVENSDICRGCFLNKIVSQNGFSDRGGSRALLLLVLVRVISFVNCHGKKSVTTVNNICVGVTFF